MAKSNFIILIELPEDEQKHLLQKYTVWTVRDCATYGEAEARTLQAFNDAKIIQITMAN